MSRFLPVSGAAMVQREFGPLFTDLSEQAAVDLIEEHLGHQVRLGAVYILNLLTRLPQPAAPASPQPHQNPRLLAGASPAAALGACCQAPLSTEQSSQAGSNGEVATRTSPFAAAAAAAAAAVAAAAPLAAEAPLVAPHWPRGSAMLFAALLLSECGRGVAALVRHLLVYTEEEEQPDDSSKQSGDGQDAADDLRSSASGAGGSGRRSDVDRVANGINSGASGRRHRGGSRLPHPCLRASSLRALLTAVVQLCEGPRSGLTLCLPEVQRLQLAPLRDAIVGELQAYDYVRAIQRSGSLPVAAVNQGPPYALRGLVLTREQRDVVEMVRSRCEERIVTCVQAFAGTAKTTTARAVVASLRHLRVLYLVYNKAMQEEAYQAMSEDQYYHGGPRNFTVKTTHGLAYGFFGVPEHFRDRKIEDLAAAPVRQFLQQLWAPVGRKDVRSVVVTAVRTALRRFLASADEQLQAKHFSKQGKDNVLGPMGTLLAKKGHPDAPPETVMSWLVAAAQRLWAEVSSPASRLTLPHNAYLKLWALQRPKLGRWDLIIVDEAQDINGVTRQLILELQDDAHVLLLGDRHQQIYSFNYACGLLAKEAVIPRRGPSMSLRQTFRFGPELAAAVNVILKEAFGEPEFMIGCEGQQGAIYCCLPDHRDLDDVTAEDLIHPPTGPVPGPLSGADGEGGEPAGHQRRFRFLQCPVRSLAPNPAFPLELRMTSGNPRAGVAVLPPGVFPGLRPRVTVVARRNTTLVQLALLLVAAGHNVCASFAENQGDSGAAAAGQGGGEGGGDEAGASTQGGRGVGGGGGGGRMPRMPAILRRMQEVFEFLHRGRRRFPASHVLAEVDSPEELRELVEAKVDGDLSNAYELVHDLLQEKPGLDIPALVDNLAQKLVRSQSLADCYLTTAHKMKGRQHPVIQLAEDFVELSPTDEEGLRLLNRCRTSAGGIDELNAIYVAATRARSVLLLNRDLSRLVLRLHQRHVRLAAPSPLATAQSSPPASASATTATATATTPAKSTTASTIAAVVEPITPPCRVRPAFSAPPSASPAVAATTTAEAAAAPAAATTTTAGVGTTRIPGGSPDATAAATGSPQSRLHSFSAAPDGPQSPLARRARPQAEDAAGAEVTAPGAALNGPPDPSPRPVKAARGGDGRPVATAWTGTASAAPEANETGSGDGAAVVAGRLEPPTPQQRQQLQHQPCPVCGCSVASGGGAVGGGGATRLAGGGAAVPAVLWRCRPLCCKCARSTIFGQVVELAGAEAAGQAAAAAATATAVTAAMGAVG